MMKRSCGTWAYWAPVTNCFFLHQLAEATCAPGNIEKAALRLLGKGRDPAFDSHGPDAGLGLKDDHHHSPSSCSTSLREPETNGRDIPVRSSCCTRGLLPDAESVAGCFARFQPSCETQLCTENLPFLLNFRMQRKQFGQGLVGIVASQHYLRKVNRVYSFLSARNGSLTICSGLQTQLLESEIQV
eukprot:768427-Hanusia_phi.AAC.7